MDPAKLARLLAPESIAVVGASEKLGMSNNAVLPMLDAGIDVRLVNPNRDSVYGRPTSPSLSALDEPIDAVLSLVSAERSIDIVAEAAAGRMRRSRRRCRRVRRARRGRTSAASTPRGRCERRDGRRRAELQRLHERRAARELVHWRPDRPRTGPGRGGLAERLPPPVDAGGRATAPAGLRHRGVVGERSGLRAARLHRSPGRRPRHRA